MVESPVQWSTRLPEAADKVKFIDLNFSTKGMAHISITASQRVKNYNLKEDKAPLKNKYGRRNNNSFYIVAVFEK